MVGAVIVDERPSIAEPELIERLVDVRGPVRGIGRPSVLHRIVDALAGVFNVEDLVAERAQAEQVHQRAPRHPAERITGDDARNEDLHSLAA